MFLVGKFRNGVGIGRAISSLATPLRVWSKEQVKKLKGAFLVGGHQQHGGDKWPPAKNKLGRVMIGSGRLRNSITDKVGVKEATIFTPVSYAKYHQEGRGVPKREVIVVTAQDKTALEKELRIAIDRMINGSN